MIQHIVITDHLAQCKGNGESDVSPGLLYTIASHPATPTELIKVSTHKITNVRMAEPKPNRIVRRGLIASSATLATPSIARKNQMAKGIAANTPGHPLGKALCCRFFNSKCGKLIPANNNNSPTANIVITNSKIAAALTP
jgi:hypothetical protein